MVRRRSYSATSPTTVCKTKCCRTQGKDVITGFNWEPSGPTAGAEDILSFSAFNGAFVNVQYDGGLGWWREWWSSQRRRDGKQRLHSDQRQLGWHQWFTIADNGEGVLIIGKDPDAQDGYDNFDVYYVQDVDAGAGIAVKVNLVGKIESATDVGLTSINAKNFA